MPNVPVILKEDASIAVSFGNVVSGKKGDTVELPERLAQFEVDAERASYPAKKNEVAPKE